MFDPERRPIEDEHPDAIELTEVVDERPKSAYREMTPEEKADVFENIQVHGKRTGSGPIVESAKQNLPFDEDRGKKEAA